MSTRLTGCDSSGRMRPTSAALAARRSHAGLNVNSRMRMKSSRRAGSSVIASTAATIMAKFLV